MFNKEWKYLFLITIIFTAACIETDIYLPSFTDIMLFFSVSEERIQSLLSWNFIGICLSGPFYGPISDAVGRKKPLLIALGSFFLGSLMTLFAPSFDFMLAGRVLQGVGAGGCFILGTAIIFDAFQQEKAVVAINRLNSIIPFIMAGAPMLGGYLNYTYGFRSNFLAIGICVLISLLISAFFFEETLPLEKRTPLKVNKMVADFKKVLFNIPFWQTTIVISMVFAGYLAFLSTISVLYVIEFSVSKEELPFHQAGLLLAWLIANFMAKWLTRSIGTLRTKILGVGLSVFAAACFFISTLIAPTNPYLATTFMMVYTFGANWLIGLYFPEGMEFFPDVKGVAASILTSARLLITAIIVGIASTLYNGTIFPLMGVICFGTLTTLITLISYERNKLTFEKAL